MYRCGVLATLAGVATCAPILFMAMAMSLVGLAADGAEGCGPGGETLHVSRIPALPRPEGLGSPSLLKSEQAADGVLRCLLTSVGPYPLKLLERPGVVIAARTAYLDAWLWRPGSSMWYSPSLTPLVLAAGIGIRAVAVDHRIAA